MLTLVVAVIGLIGTVTAGNAFSEWLKRRSLPETLKSELAVWSALPECEAKNNLLARIEQRVNGLAVDSPSGWRVPRAYFQVFFPSSVLYGAAIAAVLIINGGYSFRRGADGILRWHTPGDHTMTFMEFVVRFSFAYLILAIGSLLIEQVATKGIRSLFKTRSPASQKD